VLNASDVATVAIPFMLLLAAVLCAFLPLVSWRKKNLKRLLGRRSKSCDDFFETLPLKDDGGDMNRNGRRRSSLVQMIEKSRIVSMKK
jgi:hypothetical protein